MKHARGGVRLSIQLPVIYAGFFLSMASDAPTYDDNGAKAAVPLRRSPSLELLAACKSSDGEEAMRLLDVQGVDVNARDWRGKTPLIYAIEKGDEEVALALVATEGFNLNVKDKYGVTPLHLACRFSQKELAFALVANEAVDVNATDKNGKTPLDYATHEEVIACLLGRGAKHKTHANLLEACKEESTIEAMRLLGIESTPVNAQDEDGMTALHIAYIMGLKEVALALLARTDLDIRSVNPAAKLTPLSKSTSGDPSRSHEGPLKYRFVDPSRSLVKYEDPAIVPGRLQFVKPGPRMKPTLACSIPSSSIVMNEAAVDERVLCQLRDQIAHQEAVNTALRVELVGDAADSDSDSSTTPKASARVQALEAEHLALSEKIKATRAMMHMGGASAGNSPRKVALRAEIDVLRSEKAEADAAIAALRAQVAKLNSAGPVVQPLPPLRRRRHLLKPLSPIRIGMLAANVSIRP